MGIWDSSEVLQNISWGLKIIIILVVMVGGLSEIAISRRISVLSRSKADELRSRVSAAEALVGAAGKDAAEARAEVVRTRAELADTKKELVLATEAASKAAAESLAAATYRWHITDEQRKHFLARVPVGNNGPIKVIGTMNDPESLEFAAQLTAMLRAGGFDVSEADAMWTTPVRGVRMRLHSTEAPPARAIGVQALLREIEIQAPAQQNKEIPEGQIELIVGSRPAAAGRPTP